MMDGMTCTRGRCINVDYCGLAASRHLIDVPVGERFICPECATLLRPPPIRPPDNFAVVAAACAAIALALLGAGAVLGASLARPTAAPGAIVATPDTAHARFEPPCPAIPDLPAEPGHLLPQQVVATANALARQEPAILFRLQGSAALGATLVPKLAAAFLGAQGDASISVEPGEAPWQVLVTGLRAGRKEAIQISVQGDAAGMTALADGTADIAMASHRLSAAEQASLRPAGDQDAATTEHAIAGDSTMPPTKAGASPTAETLYFDALSDNANQLADRFVTFALSPEGQALVARAGFTPAQRGALDGAAAPASARDRYQQMIAGATRLSAPLHFEPGSNRLDPRSAKFLDRICNQLLLEHIPPDRLILMGFSDNEGSRLASLAQSQQLANEVADALAERGLPPGQIAAFGADLPMSDSGTALGRGQNLRVEIFLRN